MEKYRRRTFVVFLAIIGWVFWHHNFTWPQEAIFDVFICSGIIMVFFFGCATCLLAQKFTSRCYELQLRTGFICSAIAGADAALSYGVKWLWQNDGIGSLHAFFWCLVVLLLCFTLCAVFSGRCLAVENNEQKRIEAKKEEFFCICPELKEKGVVFTLWEKSMDIDYNQIHLNVALNDNFPRNTRRVFKLDGDKGAKQ